MNFSMTAFTEPKYFNGLRVIKMMAMWLALYTTSVTAIRSYYIATSNSTPQIVPRFNLNCISDSFVSVKSAFAVPFANGFTSLFFMCGIPSPINFSALFTVGQLPFSFSGSRVFPCNHFYKYNTIKEISQ